MAKKSARGRYTLAQVSRENNEPKKRADDGTLVPCDLTTWEKKTLALMSDGTVLEKFDCRFKPDWLYKDGRHHSYGWKVKGKIKKELLESFRSNPAERKEVTERWVHAYLANGYIRENPGGR